MLQLGTFLEINFDDLLESISKQKVVIGLVCDLEIGLLELRFSLGALRWSLSFALGVELGRWVEDLVETGLGLGHDISSPLSLVLEVVDKLKLVKLKIRSINLGLLVFHIFASL